MKHHKLISLINNYKYKNKDIIIIKEIMIHLNLLKIMILINNHLEIVINFQEQQQLDSINVKIIQLKIHNKVFKLLKLI